MVTKTIKVKNGSIPLPEELRGLWQGAEVFLSGAKDTILIKKMSQPRFSFRAMLDEFNKVGKGISRKDVTGAIEVVRGKKIS